jgi:hypothetical protein
MFSNPYPGINAHVNSRLQTPGTPEQPALWHSFHVYHLARLTAALNKLLLPNYFVLIGESLQVRTPESEGLFNVTPNVK